MKRKLIIGIMAALGVWALGVGSACATTYYVRLDGGTALECTGTVDSSYSGSGTGQPCAFNHPRYALGWGCTNTGNSCANGGVMQGGDTLYIDGDDPTNGGAQAQYEIGYDDTNNGLTPGCSPFWPYDCTLGNLPAGINTTQRTSIIGTGNHKPQLWGTQRVWQVLNADNNHIWLQNLEITDHTGCAYNSPDNGCNYGGPYPYGPWAVDGLYVGGDDVNVTDVYIHGLGRYGVNTDNFGSATFTRLFVIGNGYGGVSTGTGATISGTLTFNQPIIEWNGCVESYPLNTSSPIDSPSNFSDCFGQNQGGYGDGLAFGNVGHGGAGNWTIYGPGSISFNAQDGLDTLHGTGTGTIQIDKMRFEGNAGDQVKMNALTSSLTNSIVIGDCGWWSGAAQSSPGFASGDICRALGDVIVFNVTNSSQTYIYNNTILSNGNITLESDDANGTGCNGSTKINVDNNIVLGGATWIDDTSWNGAGGNSSTTYTYNDGNDGDGSGTCGSLSWNEDYNIVTGTRNNNMGCSGAHDKCGTSPGFAVNIPMGTTGGGPNTYYQGNSGITLVSLNSNSAAIASGVPGLTYWNDGKDYHNVPRTNPPSIGGLELNSCAANSYGCFFNSDCCGGAVCNSFVCGGNGGGTANVTAPAPPPSPITAQPVVSLTSPVNGSSFTVGSNVTISATASEANGSISQVAFYNNGTILLGSTATPPYEYIATSLPAGNYSLTAVATDINGVSTTSSALTMTMTSPVGQPVPIVTMTNPASGSSFTPGSNVTFTATASESNGTIAQVQFLNGGTPLNYTGTSAPYSYVWKNVQPGTYTMTAQATDGNGSVAASAPVTITVTAATAPSQAVVAMTSPANGSAFSGVSDITLTASASETNGTIAQLQFFNGGVPLNYTGSAPPYIYIWKNVQQGTYTMTAQATDSNGIVTASAPVTITVKPAAAPITVVAITSPNGNTFSGVSDITLTASASETNGTITQLQFYDGAAPLSYTGTNPPYSYVWKNVQPGTYTMTAQTSDNNGIVTASAPITITVNSAPVDTITPPVITPPVITPPVITPPVITPPVITLPVVTPPVVTPPVTTPVNSINITSPLNNTTYTVPAGILLTASVSQSSGTIARVDYYAGPIYLGEATSSPYAVSWNSAQAGSYDLTAKVTEVNGTTFYSTPVKITVNAHSAPIVGLTTPVNNASYNSLANIVLTATASAGGGSITKVDFYSGALYLGTAYNGPYTINWNNIPSGNYSLTAKATDNYGWSTVSSAVNVVVIDASSPPTNNNTPPAYTVIAPPAAPVTGNPVFTDTTVSVPLDNSNTVLTASSAAPAGSNPADTTAPSADSSNPDGTNPTASDSADTSKVLTSSGSGGDTNHSSN